MEYNNVVLQTPTFPHIKIDIVLCIKVVQLVLYYNTIFNTFFEHSDLNIKNKSIEFFSQFNNKLVHLI